MSFPSFHFSSHAVAKVSRPTSPGWECDASLLGQGRKEGRRKLHYRTLSYGMLFANMGSSMRMEKWKNGDSNAVK